MAEPTTPNNWTTTCPTPLRAVVPEEWRFSNYTEPSCIVPACSNFPSLLSECCGADNELVSHNISDRFYSDYVSCSLASTASEDDYSTYQQCIFKSSIYPFRCNDREFGTPDFCGGGIPTAPVAAAEGSQVCCMSSSPNHTLAMEACCRDEGGRQTEIVPYSTGCFAYCELPREGPGEPSFFSCARKAANLTSGLTGICLFNPADNDEGGDEGSDEGSGDGNGSAAGGDSSGAVKVSMSSFTVAALLICYVLV